MVKVQHAGIETIVNEDLEVLAGLAQLAEQFPEFQPYRPTANVAEMGRTLRRELDFGREERNLHQFAELFRDDPTVAIPQGLSPSFHAAGPDDGHDRRHSRSRSRDCSKRPASIARRWPAAARTSTCR